MKDKKNSDISIVQLCEKAECYLALSLDSQIN